MKRWQTLFRATGVLLFFVALWLPLLGSWLQLDKTAPLGENRRLADFPPWSWDVESLREFPHLFEDYFRDRFGFRNRLLRLHHGLLAAGLGVGPTPDLLVGRDGWLFYRPSVIEESDPLPDKILTRVGTVLDGYDRWMRERGIRLLFIVVPDKAAIYPEYLPSGYGYPGEQSNLSRLLSRLRRREQSERSEPGLEVLDLREALLRHKSDGLLYHRTDTHWSDLGMAVAVREIRNRTSAWFPALAELAEPALTTSEEERFEGRLSQVQTGGGIFGEPRTVLSLSSPRAQIKLRRRANRMEGREIVSVAPAPQTPVCVLMHDSFFAPQRLSSQLLRESFSRLHTLQMSPGEGAAKWLDRLQRIIENEKPGLVLMEIVERNVPLIADWPAFAGKGEKAAR